MSTVLAQVADSRDQAVAAVREVDAGGRRGSGQLPADRRPLPAPPRPSCLHGSVVRLTPGRYGRAVHRAVAGQRRTTGIHRLIMMVEGAGSRAASLVNIAAGAQRSDTRVRESPPISSHAAAGSD